MSITGVLEKILGRFPLISQPWKKNLLQSIILLGDPYDNGLVEIFGSTIHPLLYRPNNQIFFIAQVRVRRISIRQGILLSKLIVSFLEVERPHNRASTLEEKMNYPHTFSVTTVSSSGKMPRSNWPSRSKNWLRTAVIFQHSFKSQLLSKLDPRNLSDKIPLQKENFEQG